MEKINIAEILKDCPKGTKLYSPLCGECTFDSVSYGTIICKRRNEQVITFTSEGCYMIPIYDDCECVLFPSKENRDWSTFKRPFKDGDVVITKSNAICIYKSIHKEYKKMNLIDYYCGYRSSDNQFVINRFSDTHFGLVSDARFATEEEREKLFNAIKDNGYKWNAETKTLEKLSRFKAGDVLVSSTENIVLCSHIDDEQIVHYHCILTPFGDFIIKNGIGVGKSFNNTLATDAEKQRLFDKLKSAGYEYNPQTNKLEKLIEPKFKVGDKIEKCGYRFTIRQITDSEYIFQCGNKILIDRQDEFELVPNKFDITTLKEFDKVLVRGNIGQKWIIDFFGFMDKGVPFVCVAHHVSQCIPYEQNKHLLNTTNDCDEYYKTWE